MDCCEQGEANKEAGFELWLGFYRELLGRVRLARVGRLASSTQNSNHRVPQGEGTEDV